MSEVAKSLQVSLWAQPDGPNTPVRFLGCHGISSATKPKGTNTLNHCPDPVNPGQYKVSSKTKAPPGLVTFSIESKMYRVFDYLDNLVGPVSIIANVTSCAPKNAFFNWDRSFIFLNADNVQEVINNLASSGADDNEIMKSYDMEADDWVELVPFSVFRDQSIQETQALNRIFASDNTSAASICGPATRRGDTMYAVADALAGSASNKATVWFFADETWSAAASDPFGTGEDIKTGVSFSIDRTTTRVLVFRGTTDVAAPAEAAYSDDNGATWTTVNIGSTNGEFIPSPNSSFALDQNNIWVGTDLGRIYFSSDGGSSWIIQENAGIHSGDWNWIQFMDERNGFAAGAADVIAVTVDGGDTWSQVAVTGNGGDILCGSIVDGRNVWVGTDDGELFYTENAGLTWKIRSGWTGSGSGKLTDMFFSNAMVGYMVSQNNSAKATFLQTRNGGSTWEVIETPTNAGVNSLLVCSNILVYGVGEPVNSKPVIYKLQPVS